MIQKNFQKSLWKLEKSVEHILPIMNVAKKSL